MVLLVFMSTISARMGTRLPAALLSLRLMHFSLSRPSESKVDEMSFKHINKAGEHVSHNLLSISATKIIENMYLMLGASGVLFHILYEYPTACCAKFHPAPYLASFLQDSTYQACSKMLQKIAY